MFSSMFTKAKEKPVNKFNQSDKLKTLPPIVDKLQLQVETLKKAWAGKKPLGPDQDTIKAYLKWQVVLDVNQEIVAAIDEFNKTEESDVYLVFKLRHILDNLTDDERLKLALSRGLDKREGKITGITFSAVTPTIAAVTFGAALPVVAAAVAVGFAIAELGIYLTNPSNTLTATEQILLELNTALDKIVAEFDKDPANNYQQCVAEAKPEPMKP